MAHQTGLCAANDRHPLRPRRRGPPPSFLLERELFNHVDSDTAFAVLEEVGRMFVDEVAPLNRTSADTVGTVWNADGSVTTAIRVQAVPTNSSSILASLLFRFRSSLLQ
ncbi:MAG: hypothetical protein R2706_03290 [Acidimicrobiales bacterium]